MIHYHGSPISGTVDERGRFYRGRHAMVSFFRPDDLPIVMDQCQTFAVDNGAFSVWRRGSDLDVLAYAAWVKSICRHPAFDWCLIPDDIEGSEKDNRLKLAQWQQLHAGARCVPVWHLHESLEYLAELIRAAECGIYAAVALGSSGEYATPKTRGWWQRIEKAMRVACDSDGRPRCRLHGLRMLDPEILVALPLASADSTNAAVNAGSVSRFGVYPAPTAAQRAVVIADRIESSATAALWQGTPQMELAI